MPLALMLALAVAQPTPPAPRCRPADLQLGTDGEQGDFNGMSHGGTWIVVRNRSRRACSVDALPRLAMQDARGRALPVARNRPVGMHPGPVVLPVRIPAGGAVATGIRWVSGPVYADSRCYDAARATLSINGATLPLALAAHLCGPAGGTAGFDQPVLAPR